MVTRYDPFAQMDAWLSNAMRQTPTGPVMPLDLYREGDKFVALLDLPGVDPGTIDIDVEDRTLTIRAERASLKGEDLQWLTHERPTGTFARQLALGHGVAADKIAAEYSDGVLTLSIPVAEEAKPRKITVNQPGGSTVIEQR